MTTCILSKNSERTGDEDYLKITGFETNIMCFEKTMTSCILIKNSERTGDEDYLKITGFEKTMTSCILTKNHGF
jgi:hypothetical protein